MIGKITGIIHEIFPDHILLDVRDICYIIHCPFLSAASVGSCVSIYIDEQFREDGSHLYGFLSMHDKALFKILTTARGVGARIAMNIMSNMDMARICEAIIIRQDSSAFKGIPGVGPKLAIRIIDELRSNKGLSILYHAMSDESFNVLKSSDILIDGGANQIMVNEDRMLDGRKKIAASNKQAIESSTRNTKELSANHRQKLQLAKFVEDAAAALVQLGMKQNMAQDIAVKAQGLYHETHSNDGDHMAHNFDDFLKICLGLL